jgi:hypothetical protein
VPEQRLSAEGPEADEVAEFVADLDTPTATYCWYCWVGWVCPASRAHFLDTPGLFHVGLEVRIGRLAM